MRLSSLAVISFFFHDGSVVADHEPSLRGLVSVRAIHSHAKLSEPLELSVLMDFDSLYRMQGTTTFI